ncbi:molybdopterin molybdotransferase MoeA [Marinomonas dokdonensis]|uniref:molybdopterin molybdotransferase MoeA n=1 Tax=Marinomonas dokdonensis TaxID=328224 RepID=UPI0040559256
MPPLMPFEEALTSLQENSKTLVQTESCELANALNRILCEDVVAQCYVPPCDNSAMDGYALRYEDWQADKALPVSQYIAAGHAPEPLQSGTCARIFTGANIPVGADVVIMQENAQVTEQGVIFTQQPKLHDNIRPRGQDMSMGQTVLRAGTKIKAMHIGLLSSLGITKVSVYQPLKVGILTTGDELVPAGHALEAGQIYNSNGPMLQALVSQLGYQVTCVLHVKDEEQATLDALTKLSQQCDVILSSGGVSVGEKDYVTHCLEQMGQLHLWKIAIKPGKPLVHASVNGVPFLGLPGNPSSTLVTFHWFARTLLAASAGQQAARPRAYPVTAGFSRNKSIGRDEFIRVSMDEKGSVIAHRQQSSGALLAACESLGYLHIKAGELIEEGKEYDFYPFSEF